MTDGRREILIGCITSTRQKLSAAEALAEHLAVEYARTAKQLTAQRAWVQAWRDEARKLEAELREESK